ncbi:MAG: 2-isopropylmalate synthase [Verrucomicrobia bacterium]|nr:MAG: 2-isopropylmalate synthase [Verrucomicrobiota bacterium]
MNMDGKKKYGSRVEISLPDRQWPNRKIGRAPIWCSVDLRDGNQALAIPMNVEEKLKLFDVLVKIGFKQIEVGFPAASQTEFDFIRRLIDGGLIPDDVAIQVLTQSRAPLIEKTFEALRGCRNAIVHLYNSTSALQRRVTFAMERPEIVEIARRGARLVKEKAEEFAAAGTKISMEYSPESFSDTELDFALEICEAVKQIWRPTPDNKLIVNLPETVQYNTPNVYADQIEWICRNISDRDCVEISLHTHNDRGTGVAATELGLMAGADRVEGTLFGNGERTGNLDIVTVALNMYAEGVEPNLDFSDLPSIRRIYEQCTRMEVPPRHPYAGNLVFTAFSGSHQDAIKKGMDLMRKNGVEHWEVPYLLIDPRDIGCNYEAIIRINSQSGKGGVAYVLASEFGFDLPKAMHQQVGDLVNARADELGRELSSSEIYKIFSGEFVGRESPVKLVSYRTEHLENSENGELKFFAALMVNGEEQDVSSVGNGPINALVGVLKARFGDTFRLTDYRSHAIGSGSATNSAAYVCLEGKDSASCAWGVGVDSNIESAGLKALVGAFNRLRGDSIK